MLSHHFRHFLLLSSLLLLSGCGGIDFRSLPSDDPLVFAADVQDPQDQYWKPEEEVALKLSLTSAEEALRAETFHVLSATLDDGTDVLAHVTHDALTLQENTLRYSPQGPGEHTLRLRIGLDWEPEGAQETTCRIAVPAAPWRVRGKVDAAGALSFKVDGVDARWREEQWTLLPQRAWSAGVAGTLHHLQPGGGDAVWEVDGEETLRHGENNTLQVNLTQSTLADPQVRFTVQGPDQTAQEVSVDLLPLCVAQLQEGMGEVERNLVGRLAEVSEHMQVVEELYTLDEETVLDPNRNREKVREVVETLRDLEGDEEDYNRELQRLQTLDQQDPNHASRQLPMFRRAQQHLEDAVKRLKSTQVQLQEQCTTAHEALAKVVHMGEDRQEAIDILLEDPRLEVAARVRDENNQEETLLSAAVSANNATAVVRLLERGAAPNRVGEIDIEHVLHRAAYQGNEAMLTALLDHGFEVDAVDPENWTSLHMAAEQGHTDVVRLLIERGADLNTRNGIQEMGDGGGNMPLHLAIHNGHTEVVRVLLEQEGIEVDATDTGGKTALHWAISNSEGGVDLVTLLLRKDADINAKTNSLRDALIEVIPQAFAVYNVGPMREILGRGRDLDELSQIDSEYLEKLQLINLEVLLEGQIDANNDGELTPLHLAASQGYTDIVEVLLNQNGIEVDAKNDTGATPLHLAAARDHHRIVELLLDRHAEVNVHTSGFWYNLYRIDSLNIPGRYQAHSHTTGTKNKELSSFVGLIASLTLEP